jgi:opacity protein-like surface antigen
MLMKRFVPLAMSAALLSSPLVMAEVTQPPDSGMAPAAEPAATEHTPSAETVAPGTPGGMTVGGSDMTDASEGAGTTMPMDMMGMMGGGPGGCMGRPGMMGGGGMMGMMRGCPGGMMGGRGGPGMQQHYREVMGRLDLLDARLTKIETMLEHLLQR